MGSIRTVQERAACAGRLQDNYNALVRENIANAERMQRNVTCQEDRRASRPPPAPLTRTAKRTQPLIHGDTYDQDTRLIRFLASLPQCRFCPGLVPRLPGGSPSAGKRLRKEWAASFLVSEHIRRN
jgi:hypothetical protein